MSADLDDRHASAATDYGSKGNQELLFTYGFAVRDNPLDAVEGIVVGCRPSADAELTAERKRLLEQHEVPYTTRESDGARAASLPGTRALVDGAWGACSR